MKKEQFMKDLQVIYDELQFRQASLNKYYELLDESKTLREPMLSWMLF